MCVCVCVADSSAVCYRCDGWPLSKLHTDWIKMSRQKVECERVTAKHRIRALRALTNALDENEQLNDFKMQISDSMIMSHGRSY